MNRGVMRLPTAGPLQRAARRTRVERIEQHALSGIAAVRGEALIAEEKGRCLDRLGRTAITGQALLHVLGNTVAQGDPFVLDEVRLFTTMTKLGKAAVIENLIDAYTQVPLC